MSSKSHLQQSRDTHGWYWQPSNLLWSPAEPGTASRLRAAVQPRRLALACSRSHSRSRHPSPERDETSGELAQTLSTCVCGRNVESAPRHTPWSSRSQCTAERREQWEREAWRRPFVCGWPLLARASPSAPPACRPECVWHWPAASPLHRSGSEAPSAGRVWRFRELHQVCWYSNRDKGKPVQRWLRAKLCLPESIYRNMYEMFYILSINT